MTASEPGGAPALVSGQAPAKDTARPAPCTLRSATGHQAPMRAVNTSKARPGPASTRTSRRIGGTALIPGSLRAAGALITDRSGPLHLGRVGGQHAVPGLDQPLLGSGQAAGGQRIEVARAGRAVLDQPGIAQHAQVLRYRWPAHRQLLGQPPDGRRPGPQQLQDPAAYRLAQRVEHSVRRLVTHRQRLP